MKIVLCLAILVTPALWADEAADRMMIGATISALNTSPSRPDLFTADFHNAAALQSLRHEPLAEGQMIRSQAGTLVISREPMGEATWYPVSAKTAAFPFRFVTRSVTFVTAETAVVVAAYGNVPVLFVMKRESSNWLIASFRVLPEAQPKPF